MNALALFLVLLPLASRARAADFQPDDAPIAALEARYGKNVLEPDPTGVGPPADSAGPSTLLRWYGEDPKLLNANLRPDAAVVDCLVSYCVLDLILRHADDPGKFAPGAADYAAVSADHRTVTVRIRPGIRWQFPAVDRNDPKYAWLVRLFERDPPELTAEDVRFTVETVQNPDVDAASQRSLFQGATVRVLDRRTYQMQWDAPNVYALQYSATFQHLVPAFLYSRDENGRVFTKAEFPLGFNTHWYNNRLCGYGPYEFVRWTPGQEIVLRRKDDFAPLRPAIEEVRWQILSDTEQVVLRLKDGQLDHITLQPQQYKKYVLDAPEGSDFNHGRFAVKEYEPLQYLYIGWNERRPLFQDARVRRAMTLATDRVGTARHCFFGQADVIASPVYRTHPYFDAELTPLPFDIDAASKLLDEAGFGDEDHDGVRDRRIDGKKVDFRFTLKSFSGSPEFECLATVMQDDLKKIGVEMSIQAVPWSEMVRTVFGERDYDAYTGAWALGWELDLYPTWHSSQAEGGNNHVGFANPEMDSIAERFRATFDESERRSLAVRAQEILHEEQPYTFLFTRRRLTAFRPDLDNVVYRVARPQLLSFPWLLGE